MCLVERDACYSPLMCSGLSLDVFGDLSCDVP
jgi:hypothetical protein